MGLKYVSSLLLLDEDKIKIRPIMGLKSMKSNKNIMVIKN